MKFLLEKNDERKKKKEKRKKEAVDIENRNRHLIQLEVPTIIEPHTWEYSFILCGSLFGWFSYFSLIFDSIRS